MKVPTKIDIRNPHMRICEGLHLKLKQGPGALTLHLWLKNGNKLTCYYFLCLSLWRYVLNDKIDSEKKEKSQEEHSVLDFSCNWSLQTFHVVPSTNPLITAAHLMNVNH